MTGINQGTPETAIGEPIRLGDSNEFEIEQHPVSDRLIIRDTVNGKVAYVRKERGGQIGGDGVLVKALKEGKPMADDGRTYDTIQQAERAATGWIFLPTGTYNEAPEITTNGLTLIGSGYNTQIAVGDNIATVSASNVQLQNIRLTSSGGDILSIGAQQSDVSILSCYFTSGGRLTFDCDAGLVANSQFTNTGNRSIEAEGSENIIVGNTFIQSGDFANVSVTGNNNIFANNICEEDTNRNFFTNSDNNIIIGNRVSGTATYGIDIFSGGESNIVANNRVSGADTDIRDNGTGTLLDANLTGASN